MLKTAMAKHLTGRSGAEKHNQCYYIGILHIIRTFFRIKQKNCAILVIKQLLTIPQAKNSKEIAYFEVVFLTTQYHTVQISQSQNQNFYSV